MVKSHLMLKSL